MSISICTVAGEADECPNGSGTFMDNSTTVQTLQDTLKFSTFNVYWLFDTLGGYSPWKDEQEIAYHVANVSEAIKYLDADYVNLAEVEGCRVLKRLANEVNDRQRGNNGNDGGGGGNLDTNAKYETFLIEGKDTATKQDVGFLAKAAHIRPSQPLSRTEMRVEYPVRESNFETRCGSDREGTTGVSKHYMTRFAYADMDFLVLGLHFLANPSDRHRCSKREAQAMVVRDTLREILHDYKQRESTSPLNIIVMGDFNDYDDSISDVQRNVPISQVLSIIRDEPNDDNTSFTDFLDLVNVVSMVKSASARYSHWWDKNHNMTIEPDELSTLDHILVSRHMLPAISRVAYENDILYPNGNLMASDHWPLSVSFDVWHLRRIVIGYDLPLVLYVVIAIAIFDMLCILTIAAVIALQRWKQRLSNM